MANCVEPDETAHYEPSHQDLHCLHRYMVLDCRAEGFKAVSKIIAVDTLYCIKCLYMYLFTDLFDAVVKTQILK